MLRITLIVLALALPLACSKAPEPTPKGQEFAQGPPDKTPQVSAKRAAAIQKKKEADAKVAAAQAKRAQRQTYAWQLERLDQRIGKALEVAAKNPKASLGYDRAAQLHMSRARLSGDYADYAKAQEYLQKAFAANGNEDFGPFMTRARLHATLHRIDAAAEDFARHQAIPIAKDKAQQAADRLFEASLHLQRGEYEQAKTKIEQSLELYETFAGLAAKAAYLWKTAQFDEAEQSFQAALQHAPAGESTEPVAWIHLQLGLMDLERGRYEDAKKHYEDGLTVISGYWLLDEHIAEILTLTGKTQEAKALYLDIIERTNSPEFMDAMAEIHLEAGEEEKAREYIERARTRYLEQMEQFPEAAYGHALDHWLELEDDPKMALELAQKNHQVRPNAEAKQMLAQAYLKAGKAKQAKKVIEQALAMAWNTADLHLTAAEVYAALGDDDKRDAELAKAKAINPKVELEDAGEQTAQAPAQGSPAEPAPE